MIPLTISKDISVPKKDLDLTVVQSKFTHPNPLFLKNQALGFSNVGVSREIPLFAENATQIHFPRGLIKDVASLRPDFEIVDETVTNPLHFNPSQIILKPYQTPALEAMQEKNQGILEAPPGSGKTIIGIELIIRRGQKSLVLVHTRDLLQQWRWRLEAFTDIVPGTIDADQFDLKDVTIAMVQSLRKPLDASFVNQWGLVILDEAHHAPAYTFQTLLNQFPAKWRFGLTATPNRQDGLSFVLSAVLGNTIFKINRDGLYATKEILKPIIKAVFTNFHDQKITDYRNLLTALTTNAERNSLILRHIVHEAGHHFCLVLSNRIDHAEWLAKSIAAVRPDLGAEYLTSKVSKDRRTEIIEMMNQGQIHVITATQLADEGLDLRRLDRLFLTCPARSINKVSQQIGRIVRTFLGKKDAVVFDFRDVLCSLAESQYQSRLKMVYQLAGYEVEELPFIGGTDAEFLESGEADDDK